MRAILLHAAALLAALALPASASADCSSPDADWLYCEDFEGGAAGWQAWFDQSDFTECNGCPDGLPDPGRIALVDDESHGGDWSLHMPGAASGGYRGASLTYRTCDGEQQAGCNLIGYDELYYRAWVKLAPEHSYVHHFMSISGTRPDEYWGADGNAGCRPNGVRAAGTTLDFNENHELFFYTYFPEMNCDSGGYCSGDYVQNICDGCAQKDMPCSDGPECCWGNHFSSDPRPVLQRGEWVCLEMMQRLNTVGLNDGEMAFWIDDELAHRQDGMQWRFDPALQLNKVWVQHYIADGDTDQPNPIWWDDVVVSTSRIGCGQSPPTNNTSSNGGPNPTNSNSDPGSNPGSETPADVEAGGCGCRSTPGGPAALLFAFVGLLAVRRRLLAGARAARPH